MIKATYLQILNALNFLQHDPEAEDEADRGLVFRKNLPIKSVFLPMRRIMRATEGPSKDFDEARQHLFDKYKDEEGNLDESSEELQKEWQALLNTEVELNVEPFAAEALAEAGLSLVEIEVGLGPFVAE